MLNVYVVAIASNSYDILAIVIGVLGIYIQFKPSIIFGKISFYMSKFDVSPSSLPEEIQGLVSDNLNVAAFEGKFVNDGKMDLYSPRPEELIKIILPEGYQWHHLMIREVSSGVEASLEISEDSSNICVLSFPLLKSQESIIFEGYITFDRKIKDPNLISHISFKHRIAHAGPVIIRDFSFHRGGEVMVL